MKYATFWQRFAAMWVDGFVLLPFVIFFGWLEGFSKLLACFIVILRFLLFVGYHVYCHGRFGKTLGKYAMGITLVQTSGERITWRQAWLRSSVDICLGSLSIVAFLMTLGDMSDAQYYVGWMDRMRNFVNAKPLWAKWLGKASSIWFHSEVIVMLFNKKRRALHDFIAGTVVITDFDRPTS